MTAFSGGCLCGKVRYKISDPPISQGICYCRQCQLSGGGCGSPVMVLHKQSFEYSSEALSFCRTKSDRGSTVTRNFCRECGSHIFSQISDVQEIITIKASTLDDFDLFSPEYLVWTKNVGTLCALPTGIPAFPENAPLDLITEAADSRRKKSPLD